MVRDIDAVIRDRQRLQTLTQLAQLRTELAAAMLERHAALPEVLDHVAAGLADAVGDVCVIAMVDSQRGSPEELLAVADLAMFEQKRRRRSPG